MPERLPCEFILIRYVPDVVKGEFVNIGVLLREANGGGSAASPAYKGARDVRDIRVRFTRDWSRVRCMDADADTGLLEALEQEIVGRLRAGTSARDPRAVLEVLEDSLSNSVQMTEPRATLAENLATGMEDLMRLYVEPIRVEPNRTGRTRAQSGRAQIQTALRKEFERAGVWGLMRKKIAASLYTRPGDPLRIDCGYRAGLQPGGPQPAGPQASDRQSTVRMFHAVSLDGDVEAAKGLAFSAPRLREGVDRVESALLELTAVVEPLKSVAESGDEAYERYRFGVEAMEREAIRVVTLNDLARAAETAKRELGL